MKASGERVRMNAGTGKSCPRICSDWHVSESVIIWVPYEPYLRKVSSSRVRRIVRYNEYIACDLDQEV